MTAFELTSSLCQLEFSLLALRDDPLPALKTQLEHLERSGNHSEASQVFVKINNENLKRERWAVRRCTILRSEHQISITMFLRSSKTAFAVTTTSGWFTRCWSGLPKLGNFHLPQRMRGRLCGNG